VTTIVPIVSGPAGFLMNRLTFFDGLADGEGCFRYALLMDRHPGHAERAARYRGLTCTRGYAPACGKW
jgi:hypothetical protein